MAKRTVKVPAEIIQKIQKDFELDNYQLADFFGISLTSALDWLKYGIKNQRGNNIAFVDSILAMQWLAEKYPDRFVSKSELKTIIQTIVKTPGLLYMNFLPYKEELGPTISVLKHQRLVSAIMATLFMTLLKSMGRDVNLDITEPIDLTTEFY